MEPVGLRRYMFLTATTACRLPALFGLLDRRTRYVAVGTEHAAIPSFGPKQRATVSAFVEELASVRGHRFRDALIALWASEC